MAKKQKKNKKWISWLIFLILFAVATVVVYLVWDAYFRKKSDGNNNIQKSEQVEVVRKDNNDSKNDSVVEVDETEEKPKTIQYEGEDPNTLEGLSGVVTYAGVTANNLMIRVNIDQYLEEGACELDLMKEETIIYGDVVGIIGNVATSTCEGFDIPVDEIGEGGLEIVIKLESGDKKGVIYGGVNI